MCFKEPDSVSVFLLFVEQLPRVVLIESVGSLSLPQSGEGLGHVEVYHVWL